MEDYKNNQRIDDGNELLTISLLSVIGDRKEQQDAFGYSLDGNRCMVVVCDGMGGHSGGQIASRLSVKRFIADFDSNYQMHDPVGQLITSTKANDSLISGLTNPDGSRMNAGSTCVAVVVKDNELFWCSVGDSRAYIKRGGKFVQFTQDQNYGVVLKEKLRIGQIDKEQYERESERSETLISYIGIGNISLIDFSEQAIKLEKGDKIVIMTDGLYRLVPENEIQSIVNNFNNTSEALDALELKAKKRSEKHNISRDNMTVAICTVN